MHGFFHCWKDSALYANVGDCERSRLGGDANMMPHIDLANVTRAFHAFVPTSMWETVRFGPAVTNRKAIQLLISVLAVEVLAGCTASDDTAARFLVAPDLYVLYNCPQLADAAQTNATRQRELEKLMAKADTDSSGRVVSGMAYRPEYVQLRGEMSELRKEAATKHCRFTPGTDMPADRKSDAAVR